MSPYVFPTKIVSLQIIVHVYVKVIVSILLNSPREYLSFILISMRKKCMKSHLSSISISPWYFLAKISTNLDPKIDILNLIVIQPSPLSVYIYTFCMKFHLLAIFCTQTDPEPEIGNLNLTIIQPKF